MEVAMEVVMAITTRCRSVSSKVTFFFHGPICLHELMQHLVLHGLPYKSKNRFQPFLFSHLFCWHTFLIWICFCSFTFLYFKNFPFKVIMTLSLWFITNFTEIFVKQKNEEQV